MNLILFTIDEVQLAANFERGYLFTEKILEKKRDLGDIISRIDEYGGNFEKNLPRDRNISKTKIVKTKLFWI